MYIILFVYKHVNNGDADHKYNHVVYKNYNYMYIQVCTSTPKENLLVRIKFLNLFFIYITSYMYLYISK